MGGSTAGNKLEIARGSDSIDRDPEKAEPFRRNSTLPIHKDINRTHQHGPALPNVFDMIIASNLILQ
jgi:hypothetical protein